ncbi:hypothetical protein GUI12_03290 [Anaplasmataceae bacterium AB001_6]|nr:hypothetical protein GUI12_03290 [Anaplasmataceae bacterium AB001_6]
MSDFLNLQFVLSFLVILLIIIIPFLVWFVFVKKNLIKSANSQDNALKIKRSIYVTRKQKVAIIEYHRHEYLILLAENHAFLIDKIGNGDT